jgi:phage-related protein
MDNDYHMEVIEAVERVNEKQKSIVYDKIIKAMGDAAISSLPILVDSLMSLITSLTKSLVDSLPLLIDTVLTVVEKIATSLGTDILPVLLPSITEAVVLVAETLVEHLPTLLSAALTIVTGIAEGLLESMPILLDKLPIILAGIITFLVQSMPMIEEAGAQLLGSLMDNMPAILNMLAKAIPKLIQGIILGLMEHYPEMLQGGSDLLLALVEVIPEVISAFLLAIPEFFDAVIASFNEALPDIKRMAYENSDKVVQIFLDMLNNAKQWGKDLLENFIDGIKSKFDKLKNTVKSAAQTVKDFLGFSEPKEGPLSDFHKYAPDMIDLFVKGLHDNIPKLNDAFEEILLPVQDGEAYGTSGARGGVTMNIYASKMTPAEVFEESRIQLERMALMNV